MHRLHEDGFRSVREPVQRPSQSIHRNAGANRAQKGRYEVTRQRADEKAKYRKTPDGKLLYLPSTRTHQYLRGQVLQRPEQFRAEIYKTGGTPKQQAQRVYLKRLIANLRPNVMRQWYGSTDGPASVMTRQMTNDERRGPRR
jgi:hypothetical protein